MIGQNFPMSEYYRENILDARTLTNRGGWWSAVLLIKDPRTKKPFVSINRWQHTKNSWKLRSRIHIRSKKDLSLLLETLNEYVEKID